MNKASTIRYGAATALGLAMSAALLSAATMGNRASDKAAESKLSEKIAVESAQSLQVVDLTMAAMAQTMATTAAASGGTISNERFVSMAQRFFALTDDTQGIAFFRSFDNQQTAAQFAAPNAETIAEFRTDSRAIYLAASKVARDRRNDGSRLAFSGNQGRLPEVLVSGKEARDRMGQVLNFDLPLSSPLFEASSGGVAPVNASTLYNTGNSGFWRMLAVRGVGPDGQLQTLGVLAAFVDAAALFASPNVPALTLSGPFEVTALPEAHSYSDGGAARDIAVATGNQGFVISYPAAKTSLPWSGWLFALLGGLMAAATTFYAMTHENKGRVDAERRLALHRREFKKRTAELKRSEDRFRRLAESTNVIPWAADVTEGRFTYIGPQIERLCGYPAKSWCAKGFWGDHVHPDDRRTFADRLSQLKGGDYATIEYKVRSADGRVVHMRNMLTLIESRGQDGKRALVAQGYLLDITEMKTAQVTLDEARRGAEQANKSKSEFLANMSHELRTPLNSVIGFAEVMKDEVFGSIGERYKEYAESVHTSGQHLLSLINDVLDLSKIEAGKIELVEEETDLAVVLSKCRQLLHERASQAGLHIRLEIPAPLPFVIVDGRRIKQVILNLMSNAVKFTPPGGRLTLRAELIAPQGLQIAVTDTGIGMTPEEVDVALEQFGQIDNDLSRQHDGTGLGLPIARSLAELHGGRLDVESKKDVGTTVALWLPMSRIVPKAGAEAAKAG